MTAPCPSWCVKHSDDCDDLAEPGERHTRLHDGPTTRMRYQIEGGRYWVSVTAHLERYDIGGTIGTVALVLYGTEEANTHRPQFDGGLNNAMGVQDVARFSEMLMTVAAANGPTDGPRIHAREMNEPPLCERVECRDCVQSFCPDSSPHLDRCYECAARVDGEVLV